jgi:hypothetical protein
MPRASLLLGLVGSLLLCPSPALGQTRGTDVELLKKEIDLLKRELDLLKRENELLKRENELLKKGGGGGGTAKKGAAEEGKSITRVTVDDVEYEYGGTKRVFNNLLVTVYATSKKGNQRAPGGKMTLIDDQSEMYTGTVFVTPQTQFGQPGLRQGIRFRLVWQFGNQPSVAPPASVKRFAAVMIQRGNGFGGMLDPVEFRNVPAVLKKDR